MTRPCHCNRIIVGERFVRGRDCVRCWHARHTPAFHTRWRVAEPLAELPMPPPEPEPLSVTVLDGARLAGGEPTSAQTGHSNASIIRWDGRLLLAYRHRNAGADVWVTTLDDDTLQPHGPGVRLNLNHEQAPMGREDPRFFVFRGRLHVAFTGVRGRQGPTSVLYARLTQDGFGVERVFYPHYESRQSWEKNWSFFEAGSHLYAVYGIKPHVVLRIEGDRATKAFEKPMPFAWSGGVLRGGACPVRIDDQFVHWFHGRVTMAGIPTYTTGAYAFDARPPFTPLRMTPNPVMWPDSRTRNGYYASVWFPCGAVLEDGRWLVSAGAHDRRIEVAEWDSQSVCRAMKSASSASSCRKC